MSPPNLGQLCDAFWAVEDELDLLGLEHAGVFVWQAARFAVFTELGIQLGVHEEAQLTPPRGLREIASHAASLVSGAALRNPLLRTPQVDAVVLEFPRTQPIDGKQVDVYLGPVVDQLTSDGREVLLIDRDYAGKHAKDPDPRRRYLDVVELGRELYRRLPHRSLPDELLAVLREAEDRLAAQLGKRPNVQARVSDRCIAFRANHAFFRALFERAQPKQLYCAAPYANRHASVAVARELGIESIEVQHGTITKYHPGYGYPTVPARGLAYLPDRIWLWSELWDELCPLPAQVKREVVGFPHLERSRERYAGVKRVEGRLLVLSQGAIGRRLASLVAQHADALSDCDIVYKLHPGEYDRGPSYAGLVELAERPNVRIVTEVDLYREMAAAEYALGVYSTAVYEAMEFGCKPVLADLPGIEHFWPLLADGRALPFLEFVSAR